MLNSSSSNNGDRNTVQRGISQTQEYLTLFASSKDLSEKIGLVYGNELNSQALGELIDAWQVQNFSTLPSVEVSPQTNLGSAKAVYAIATNTIYLSQEFIGRNSTSPQNVTSVLLEEIGHFLDAKINRFDAKGDEGEIFSRIVQNIPTSDTQLSQLQAEDDRGTITLQDGAQVNVEQAGIYTGTNLKTELQNAIPDLLDKVKNFINTDVLQGLPLLGNQLGIANPLDALFNGFKTQILSRLAIAPDLDPVAEAKQALLDVLSGALNLLQDSNGDNLINIADIDAIEGTDSVTFKLKIGQSVKTSINLSEDIGLPALGLKLRGGVTPELGFNWNLEFGVDKTTGFFINTGGAAPELSLNLKTQLVDSLGAALALDGNLGFLTLTAKDQGSLIQGDFSVDLQNPLATLSVVPKFVGNANLKLGLDASFGGSSTLPKIGTDLNLNWGFTAGNDGKTAGTYAGNSPSVAFNNVRIDVGSFFKDFADPVFGTLNDVLSPIRPLLNVITAKLPVIDQLDFGKFLDQPKKDGKDSLLDLAKIYSSGSPIFDFIDALIEVDKLTQAITALSGNGSVPLTVGSFNLGALDVRNAGFNLSTVNLGALSPIAKTADQILSELGGLEINGKQANSFSDLINAAAGGNPASTDPQFPILTDPNQVFKLLIGQDADFFKYTLPPLGYNANLSIFIPIIGPLGAQFEGDFSARVQVAVGFDSFGIKEFVNGGASDPSKIFNGFYIDNAIDPSGPAGRKSGGEVKAGIGAYGALNIVIASAGVGGEVRSTLNVLLNDPNKDNKVRLEEFRQEDCIFNPVTGNISAFLNAFIKFGIGPFSIKKKFDIAKVTLLDFALGCNSKEKANTIKFGVLATNFPDGSLYLNMGNQISSVIPSATNRILNGVAGVDDDESFTVNYKSGTPDNATLIIGYSDITKEYANVNKIIANGGLKGDTIAISDQVFTPAFLLGGNESPDEFGDQLFGGSGDDEIQGQGGSDSLYGGAGNDILRGGDDDDLLNGGAGADILDGGNGFDTISYADAKSGIKIFTNASGILVGVQGDALGDQITNIEQIEGTNFFDAIQGDDLDNVIIGLDGDDNLEGGKGDDVLLGGLGGDRLDGGDESINGDWTSYLTSQAAVNVNLFSGKASGGDATGDVLISIENVQGSGYNDNLTGNFADNYIDGFYGDDRIQGSFGADTIDGGAGNDTAIYKDSFAGVNVSLLTGDGAGGDAQGDKLLRILEPSIISPTILVPTGFNTIENLVGSRFGDTLEGDIGDNKLEGLAGDDILRGDNGNDTLIGGAGADFLDGGLGIDTADYSGSPSAVNVNFQATGLVGDPQGSGGDALGDTFTKTFGFFGDSTVENLIGSKFGDTLIADGGFNTIIPGLSSGGIDRVNGGANADLLIVDYSVRDTGTGVTGGYSLGSVSVGSFSRLTTGGGFTLDRIDFSNIERLIVTSTFKDDTIYGGSGNDIIISGDGDDTIYGGYGANFILAGNGDDIVVDQNDSDRTINGFTANTSGIFLDGGGGIDTLSIDLSNQATFSSLLGYDNVILVSLNPTVENPNQKLFLTNGTTIVNFEIFKDINTDYGNDTLIQLGRVDNIFNTSNGKDTVNAGLGIDVVNGGDNDGDRDLEDDLLIIDYSVGDIGTGILAADFSENNATQGGKFYRNALDGTLLDQTAQFSFDRFNITGTNQRDTIYGGDRNDILIGNGGNDLIIGNDGNDTISGGDGNDNLIAGLGDDLIDGGSGNDSISDSGFTFNGRSVIFTEGGGNDTFNGDAGNDFIVGGQGNDILNGGADNDVLIGVDYGANQFQVAVRDRNQVDLLTGGTGADEFWLGDGTYVYYDDGIRSNPGRTNYGLITDFNPLENDVIQLNGSQANYTTLVANGNTEIFRRGVIVNELIGIVQGVTDFNLGASYVRYVNTSNAISASSSNFTFSENAENLDLVQNFALSGAVLEPDLTTQSNLDVLRSLLLAEGIAPELSLDTIKQSSLAPSLALATDFEITQNGDGDALLANFLGTTTGLSNFNVNLKGSSQAFGTFTNDPFGLGSGIVLSTGKVTDLAGKNTADGGLSSGTNTKLKFTQLSGKAGPVGSIGTGVFVADISNLGFDLKSLTFADSSSLKGGAGGRFSGFDLDSIKISNQKITNAVDIGTVTGLDVFDFSPVGTIFTAGTQRQPSDPTKPDLFGTVNGYINNGVATLDTFDAFNYFADDRAFGAVSLGDGGKVGFNLTNPVLNSAQPLYLYVGEAANNGETPDGLISASNRDVNSLSDLSTDFGIPGVADDTISMEVEFDADASTTNIFFQFAFGSEELLEFAGKFNDAFSLELNGVNLAALTNGNEVTINNLAINPVGPYSPDLIYNPVSTPANLQTKLDGYTKLLTFVGEVEPNSTNKLVITVKDNRDGLLDSAVFLKAGSFSTTPVATTLAIAPLDADKNEGNSGNTPFTFTVTRSGNISGLSSVSYTITNSGTNPADSADFGINTIGTVDFAPNVTSQIITINVNGDTEVEPDETFSITLVGPNNATITTASTIGTIRNDDTSLNNPPRITSGNSASFAECRTGIAYTVTATDPDPDILTYSISGTDSDLFNINTSSGAIKFKNVPNFEAPADLGADNVYDLTVTASDGFLSSSLAVAITVTNINEINGTGTRDPLTGTNGDDCIVGGTGAKTVTGLLGNDHFEFNSEREIGQRITDFTVGEDKIVLTGLLRSIGYSGSNPITDNFIRFVPNSGVGSFLQLDRDGITGSAIFRNFVQVNISPTALNDINNFVF